MAVIRDVMPTFELFQPTSADDAVALLAEHGRDAMIIAGGLDNFDWLKDRLRQPKVVVDLGGVDELRGIREVGGGLEIGAMTTLTAVAAHPLVRERYRLLSQAASLVASPQIRHQGTIGGNISQDTRCWYYRGGWPCYRAGGNICYADTPTALNREHAIFEADRCVAVSPSDTAPALLALQAQMVVRNRRRDRLVDADNYFVGPSIDITRMTVLQPGDLLTAIRIPSDWAGAHFYFEKVSDRKVWDFPLVNIAAALVVSGDGTIERARIALAGVSPRPLRLPRVERALRGRPANDETAEMAGQMAVDGARPLRLNGFKVPLMANLVKRAVRGEETAWTS